MSENNNARNENTPEENVNWPTFDYNEQNWPANRLYVSELPENATPGVRQRRDDSQELYLKFDWYFSSAESEIQSREFTLPKSEKKFLFKARSSPWMEHGRQVQVLLQTVEVPTNIVSLEFTATLRSPNWKSIEELRGCQEFNFACKSVDLFSIKGKPVDVWPADQTAELTADMDLIPRVFAIKGTLKFINDRIQNWKLVTRPTSALRGEMSKDYEEKPDSGILLSQESDTDPKAEVDDSSKLLHTNVYLNKNSHKAHGVPNELKYKNLEAYRGVKKPKNIKKK